MQFSLFKTDLYLQYSLLSSPCISPCIWVEYLPISFVDALHFIKAGGYDVHFATPYTDFCHHCIFKFDYIGKVETFSHDINFIIDHQFPPGRGKTVRGNVGKQTGSHSEGAGYHKHLTEFDSLPADLIEVVNNTYRQDLEMFGYEWNNIDGKSYAACTGDCC